MNKKDIVEMVVNADFESMTNEQLAEFCRATMPESFARMFKEELDAGGRSNFMFFVGGAQSEMRAFMDPKEELFDSYEEALEAAWNRWQYFS